jgi:hypothetical protein
VSARYTIKEVEAYFEWLNNLRDSGLINMWEARPYLTKQFKLDSDHASKVLTAWMKSDFDASYEDRAKSSGLCREVEL